MDYFFDTSAIVKLYHRENGSEKVLSIYEETSVITISELAKVEFVSTIYKKLRNKEVSEKTSKAITDRFMLDCENRFTVVPLVPALIEKAFQLIEDYGKNNNLFTLDALQLASYILISDKNTSFVCADKKLLDISKNLGHPVLEL